MSSARNGRPGRLRERGVWLALLWLAIGCRHTPDVTGGAAEAERRHASKRLGNGVLLIETGEATITELGLFARASPDNDPMGLEGLGTLFVSLALEKAGTTSEASPSVRALALGGRFEAVADGALLGWVLRLMPCETCGPERVALAWDLLLDVALAADLRASTVTRRAEQHRDRLLARVDTVSQAAWRWAAAISAGHGRPIGATPTEGAAGLVNREALVRYQRSLMSPDHLVLVGPSLPEAARTRLEALVPAASTSVRCAAPPQVAFGLASTGAAEHVVARSAPGPGMVGRTELEAALEAARHDLTLRERRVELVDLGAVSVLLDEDGDEPLESWLAKAQRLPRARRPETTLSLARDGLYGAAPRGAFSLGEPLTVWYGDPERFPTLPVMLPRDSARCHPL